MAEQAEDAVDNTVDKDKTITTLPEKTEKVEVTPEKAAVATKKHEKIKKARKQRGGEVTLASGIRVRYHSVAANIFIETQGRIPDPEMVTYKDPKSGKDEANPGSPTYLTALAEVERLRAQATMNALLLFGLELLDPVPEENDWLYKAKFMNLITDEEFTSATTEGNEFLRELFYKKFVVTDATALAEISTLSGVTKEMVAQARESFQSNT